MISFIIKHWRLIVDMAIVVALVLAFTFWDPFGIFNNRKLVKTANIVSQVKDIGQLVTAEYYGEVISSSNGIKLRTFPEDTISQFSKELYADLRMDLSDENLRKVDGYAIKDLANKPYFFLYQQFIAFLGTHYTNKKLKHFYDDRKQVVSDKVKNRVFRRMFNEFSGEISRIRKKIKDDGEADDAVENYRDSIPPFVDDFYNFYMMLNQRKAETLDPDRNIVFIGRGWVKAGFNFDVLDSRNFSYDETNKIVHFFGFKPQILDADINPWFIPENKVKGFELISYSKKLSFEDAKKVKADCKDQLLLQAHKAGIIKQAKVNGEEALRTFFALLLDEPGLRAVIHLIPHDHQLATIQADSVVSLREALIVDSLYNVELNKIADKKITPEKIVETKLNLVQFILQLKKLSFIRKGGYPFNYFTMKAAAMLRDSSCIRMNDITQLAALRSKLMFVETMNRFGTTKVVNENPYWFQDSDFMTDFNALVKVLNSEADFLVGVKEAPLNLLRRDNAAIKIGDTSIVVLDTIRRNNIRIVQHYVLDSIKEKPYRLEDYRYDSRVIEFLNSGIIHPDSLARILKDPAPPIYHGMLDGLRNDEIKQLADSTVKIHNLNSKTEPLRRLRRRFMEMGWQ